MSAVPINVFQETGSGTGIFNPLGQIDSFDTLGTLESYYNLSSSSYGGTTPAAASETSLLFFVSGSNGLGFFNVLDAANDGTGGNASISYTVTGSPGASVLVSDDFNELTGAAGAFTGSYTWLDCCTDGGVIGSLTGLWTLDVAYNTVPTGILGTTIMTGPMGAFANFSQSAIQPGQRFRFQAVSDQVVPEPASVALLGAGIIGLIAFRRRKSA